MQHLIIWYSNVNESTVLFLALLLFFCLSFDLDWPGTLCVVQASFDLSVILSAGILDMCYHILLSIVLGYIPST